VGRKYVDADIGWNSGASSHIHSHGCCGRWQGEAAPVQLREGLDTAELQGWMALGVFRVRRPDAGMPECTTLVRGCMDYGDFGMSAR